MFAVASKRINIDPLSCGFPLPFFLAPILLLSSLYLQFCFILRERQIDIIANICTVVVGLFSDDIDKRTQVNYGAKKREDNIALWRRESCVKCRATANNKDRDSGRVVIDSIVLVTGKQGEGSCVDVDDSFHLFCFIADARGMNNASKEDVEETRADH